MRVSRLVTIFTLALTLALLSGVVWTQHIRTTHAETIEEIKAQISDRSSQIKQLEQEIAGYKSELATIGSEKRSLQSELATLAATDKKLRAEAELTRAKIAETGLKIDELNANIKLKEEQIQRNREAITETIQDRFERDNQTMVELVLYYNSLSEFWDELATLDQITLTINNYTESLKKLKAEMASEKADVEENKVALEVLQAELQDRMQLVALNQAEQGNLLALTKDKEADYQSLLSEREARKQAFEQEMEELESKLQLAVDPTSIPTATGGVLGYPVANPIITQYFGNTPFATANPQVYSGKGHNGIDFGTPIGTPILSAESGVVAGSGNTDTTCPGASYGKWVLIRHENGLSSLYAHLSTINVSSGQTVARGQTIAYSGNTGYSTGPHLHFTVYASDGVQVTTMPSRACGGVYTLPLADQKAYLNPLSFLQ